jgi:hypothetical protein
MLLSNKLIYGDRLRCGSDTVAKRRLVLPNPNFLGDVHRNGKSSCSSDRCWLQRLMSERQVFLVCFYSSAVVRLMDEPIAARRFSLTQIWFLVAIPE